ncbi:MAG TPA: BTAD domain-containing putative transcriptional regulator [Candidatus Acidoferrales bacterium]|nr:BTAD domain-containing putative transcriptional regulator [Candidatus Acidoferrales bacterium]
MKILLQHDAWREDGLRLYMELRRDSGDRAGALREYHDFARRLNDEVGASPMAETTQLFESIVAANEPVSALSPSTAHATVAHNLPQSLTTLHGREQDVLSVQALVKQTSLVTLSGAGGVGKTRLAIEAAFGVVDVFADGVRIIEFASVSDPALVVASVAAVLGIHERDGVPLTDCVVEVLKTKNMLLVFDNCEHLVEAIAKLAYRLVQLSSVRILATSREPLRVAGEAVFHVLPLSTPEVPIGRLPTIEDLKHSAAVRLFLDRASAAVPQFHVSESDGKALVAICRRLDGIPFAIELAAARLRVLSIRSLAERLDDRFKLLGGGSRTALLRHQTLRALLDWSHNLLGEDERRLFHRLSIFAGRFTLEAATTVCAEDESEKLRVLDLLSALVDKSLVVAEPRDDRYRLLESTREYARERLHTSGEHAETSLRYAKFYANIAVVVDDLYWTLPAEEWLRVIMPEAENLLDALHWCFDVSQEYDLGGEIAGRLVHFWCSTAYRAQGKKYIDRALSALPAAVTPTLAQLFIARSRIMEFRDVAMARRAVELFEQLDDKQGRALAYAEFAVAATLADADESVDHFFTEATEIFRNLNRPRMLANVLELQSITHFRRANYLQSAAFAERTRALYQLLGDDVQAACQLARLAECRFAVTGNVEESLELAHQAYTLYGAGHHDTRLGRLWCLTNLAAYNVVAEKFGEAYQRICEALSLSEETGSETFAIYCAEFLAAVEAAHGDVRRAARMIGYTGAYLQRKGVLRYPTERACFELLMRRLQMALPADELEMLLAEGAASGRELMSTVIAAAVAAGYPGSEVSRKEKTARLGIV